jgi:hypothetical protein
MQARIETSTSWIWNKIASISTATLGWQYTHTHTHTFYLRSSVEKDFVSHFTYLWEEDPEILRNLYFVMIYANPRVILLTLKDSLIAVKNI